MLGNNPTSNNAIRFGAAILLGTAIAYLIWSASSSSSSSSQKTGRKEVKKTTKTVTSEKKTEVKKGTTTIESEPTVEAAAEATVETTIERTIEHTHEQQEQQHQQTEEEIAQELERSLPTPVKAKTRGDEITDHMNAATNKEMEIAISETEETAPVADIAVEVAEIAMIEAPMEVEVEVEQVVEEEQEQEVQEQEQQEETVSHEEIAVIEDVITQEHVHEETTETEDTEVVIEKEIATSSFAQKEIMEAELEIDTPTTLVEEEHYSKVNLNLNSTNNLEESRWTSKRVVDDVQTLAEISLVAQHSELNAQAVEFTPSWSTAPRYVPAPIARPRNPTTRSEEPAKMKSRCRFWPKCTNKSCKFVHPTVYCRDPANCTFGERCVFIHPSDVVRMHETQENGKKNQRRNANRTRRPQSSDSSASMVSVSPVESPMK
ncbi:hypothetical protein BG006_006458 [Podila minutissima]|uniref:C3H1-type domain-containing protein n=1 Tax=Podila minutissima TaxID=64525 RepID=A0A9P5SLK0_9FUNG|nr:hypothetical protein BG006_006458 [Podila minutissima]